ncbi:Retrovirus-related Pol polyprotein from type-2 retrotransposable element R2DM [Araneus ventricosus]|uniref:Retrovirus-related Pol polyprotein from type-2 retrotransposable element R2DM n=1 Tax=Araneus ventricosus TaxID=182803 RepID=A0A4Y2TIC5_ARAVE|nr:Retrovirus-related Pol polyprotein from type-2 retrotransposable element R2DM [Araneus ventricosus]
MVWKEVASYCSTCSLVGAIYRSTGLHLCRVPRRVGIPLWYSLILLWTNIFVLPDTIGVPVGGHWLNYVAFADDMLLFPSTEIIEYLKYVPRCSIPKDKILKSFTISLIPSGRDKKVKIAQGFFRVGNTPIPHLGVDAEWTYLEVPFTPTGKAKVKILEPPRPKLEILTKAPLKPQQRLFFLRCPLLPGVHHLLALGELPSPPLKRPTPWPEVIS